MLKCPFCNFENEEGALFCEQCKSDLSGVESAPAAPPVPVAHVMEETIPMAQAMPMEAVVADVVEATPVPSPPPDLVEPVVAAEALAPAAETPAPPAAPPAPAAAPLAADAQPKLVVIRGQKLNAEYPIYPDLNFIGRADEKPVDIDLEDQEPPDRVWCSRQHALITFESGLLTIEDLNSANGTYVNRNRVYPGQKRQLSIGDVIQIGNVQMKLKV